MLVFKYLMGTGLDLRKFGGANAYLKDCPSRAVLDVLGNKWTMLTVGALRDGAQRFTELRRRLDGITQKMLTQTLRTLERHGLVTRTLYPTIPPRVDYELTALGQSIGVMADSIRAWAEENAEQIFAARADYDARPDPIT